MNQDRVVNAYIEGYLLALEHFEIELDYIIESGEIYSDEFLLEHVSAHKKAFIKGIVADLKRSGASKDSISRSVRTGVALASDSLPKSKKEKESQKTLDYIKGKGKKDYEEHMPDAIKAGVRQAVRYTIGSDEKANQVGRDMVKMNNFVYKQAVRPKFDKESTGRKILRGDLKGAAKKVAAVAVSKLHKFGKNIHNKNEKDWDEIKSNIKQDNRSQEEMDAEAYKLKKEAKKWHKKLHKKPAQKIDKKYNELENKYKTKDKLVNAMTSKDPKEKDRLLKEYIDTDAKVGKEREKIKNKYGFDKSNLHKSYGVALHTIMPGFKHLPKKVRDKLVKSGVKSHVERLKWEKDINDPITKMGLSMNGINLDELYKK